MRERNLNNGILTEKDVEQQRAKLADLADQTDPVTEGQPAVGDDEDDDLDEEAS